MILLSNTGKNMTRSESNHPPLLPPTTHSLLPASSAVWISLGISWFPAQLRNIPAGPRLFYRILFMKYLLNFRVASLFHLPHKGCVASAHPLCEKVRWWCQKSEGETDAPQLFGSMKSEVVAATFVELRMVCGRACVELRMVCGLLPQVSKVHHCVLAFLLMLCDASGGPKTKVAKHT